MNSALKHDLTLDEVNVELSRRKYREYVNYVYQGAWKPARYLIYLCNVVQKFIELENIPSYRILAISLPPQHGKSWTITETLPSWYLGKYPEKKCILLSYNDVFARKFGRKNKEKIKQFGDKVFNINLAQKPNSDTEFELLGHNGGAFSQGITAGMAGKPANLIIIDDPLGNEKTAGSQVMRDRIWDEWQSSIKARLSAGSKVIVIMTRWHQDDLIGKLLDTEGDKITYINIPCECEEEKDVLGRVKGDALAPELGKNNAWLKDYKKSFSDKAGKKAWYSQYQGNPIIEGGNILKRKDFRFYTQRPVTPFIALSVDASFKKTESGSYVSIQAWGKLNADYYLLDRIKGHWSFTETVDKIRSFKKQFQTSNVVYIEEKANGSAIIDTLRNEISGIVPVNPKADSKESRLYAITPLFEAGNVYVPHPSTCDWVYDLINECVAFPNAKHDDDVDAMTQCLDKIRNVDAAVDEAGTNFMPIDSFQETSDILGGEITDSYINGGWNE